jgi:biotin synthase
MNLLETVTQRALQGIPATIDQAMELNDTCATDELCDAADRVRAARTGAVIDTCSIVNARSGRCTEDCKWCAQSRHHHTGVAEYEYIPEKEMMDQLTSNTSRGVARFSLVTSGRKVAPADLGRFCDLFRKARAKSPIFLCASMGLLNKQELQQLWDAGVRRYHCNLETSASYFPNMCSTHTHADKVATIKAAREVGMEICCGGIIGMGETMRQRLELAEEAREAGASSIPINILNPIKGTPLQDTPLLEEDDVIRTVALFRLVAPDVTLRFAGGRSRLSEAANRRILRGGMNGALVGDMLTTVGNNIDQDYKLFTDEGFTIPTSEEYTKKVEKTAQE